MKAETTLQPDLSLIWEGTPNHIINGNSIVYQALAFIAIVSIPITFHAQISHLHQSLINLAYGLPAIPLLLMLWNYLDIKTTKYRITTEQIFITTGILSKETQMLELYRVKDYTIIQPLFMRVAGCSTIILETSDRTNPRLELKAVKAGEQVINKVRECIEKLRAEKGIREFDNGH